jgi:hypothetical protein
LERGPLRRLITIVGRTEVVAEFLKTVETRHMETRRKRWGGSPLTSDFHLAKDGHGGTYISDPSGAAAVPAAAARFVAAIAGLRGARDQFGFASVHDVATALMSAPSLFTAAATSGR